MTIRRSVTVILDGDPGPVNEWAVYLAAELRYHLENDHDMPAGVTYWLDEEEP